MSNNEYQTVGLYEHNANSYRKVKASFAAGEKVVGIVHATGTGKSYNALQLAYDNKDKKIVYVVPSNGIIEHVQKIIEDNPNLDMKRDFPNLEFRTYQSFISLSRNEIESIDCDLLILDEFHHIGAPIWGARIDTMLKTHPNIKVFGMTAYTVRDRGTVYEKDMANPETDELFSGKIKSRYDLCDAMIDGILPKPIYKSSYTNLIGLESRLEEKVQKLNANSKEYQEYMAILSDIKRRIHEAPSIPNILRKSIKPNGKYIYFCPPYSEENTNDIETIKNQALAWFKQFVPEEDIIFYTSTSEMREEGKRNRNAFYDDVTLEGENAENKLRVMFAINQYNEGIHAPNVDGVIMGRGTASDIVYFEQLGRALSVRGNTKEMFDKLEMYSIEELIQMCKDKDITVRENESKEDLIEKLIAPVVIDLANNYEFIKELENNLKDRIKSIQTKVLGTHRDIKIRDAAFDIEMENQNLFEMLIYVRDRLTMSWEEYYELAKTYYEKHGNLEISYNYETDVGIKLGQWISRQRQSLDPESERGQKLLDIGMRFNKKVIIKPWEEMFEYAKAYYEEHGNLEIPYKYETDNGIKLGQWISGQRQNLNPESERGQKLLSIGMRFDKKVIIRPWEEMFEYAKAYYEEHGNLEIPYKYETDNGIKLGQWISGQRQNLNPESERGQKLLSIGMRFDKKVIIRPWEEMYEYAKAYYKEYGDLEVSYNYETDDGIKLGQWITNQRHQISPESEHGQKLLNIGMRFDKKIIVKTWEEIYEYAKAYYEEYGDLEVPYRYKTDDGIKLGRWIVWQRKITLPESEQGQKLLNIGMRFDKKIIVKTWEEMFEYAKAYYEEHGDLEVPYTYKIDDEIKLGRWIVRQRQITPPESEQGQKLLSIGMNFDKKAIIIPWEEMYEYAKVYYEEYGDLEVPTNYETASGVKLGQWISNQRQTTNPESERGQKLSAIEMRFEKKKIRLPWEEMYEYAKNYYKTHGHLDVPQKYETDDRIKLGQWISNQRQITSPESEHGQKLLSIGMRFDKKLISRPWEEYYELAKVYYEKYGNLRIPNTYETENGVKLGIWIASQRQNVDRESEHGKLLESIGMIWNTRKNYHEVLDICGENGINYQKNKIILNHISTQELQSKIEFLKVNNMPIIDLNGFLVDIFHMSNQDMKEKYGISLEELINEYYITNKTERGV